MTIADIEGLVRGGESDSIEFKKSTGQLARAAETMCGFPSRTRRCDPDVPGRSIAPEKAGADRVARQR